MSKHKTAYFHMRDELARQSGYTRVQLHQLIKDEILPNMVDEEDCWRKPIFNSTRYLNDKGWEIFLEQFKAFTFEMTDSKL